MGNGCVYTKKICIDNISAVFKKYKVNV